MGRNQAKKQATPQPAKVANATGNKRPLAPTSGKAIKRGKFDEHVQRSGRYEESDDEEVDEDDEEEEEEEEGDEDENGSEDDEEGDSEGDDDEDDEEEGSDDGFRPAEGYAVGIDAGTQYPGDIEALQSLMYESELNFICLDLNHAAPLLDQLSLDSGELNSVIMGKLDLPAVDASQWSSVEKNVFSQYAFAAHMGLQAVLIKIHPSIASDSWQLMQVCRMITNMLSKFPPTAPQLWLRIPMDQWQLWDAIRHGIDHHTHVFLALDAVEVTNGAKVFDAQEIRRWLAEPIKAVLLDSEHLLGSDTTAAAPTAPPKDKKTKGKGSTSAGTSRQAVTKFIPSEEMVGDFLRTFFDFKMHFIIVPAAAHKIPNNPESFMDSEALSVALQRLQFQFAMWRETPLAEDEDVAESLLLDQNFSFSFRDKLQTPLDPLHQNLDLETYRVMEEDPIKYQRYEMALIAATRDLKKTLGKAVTPTTPLRILVVGPGRGPLIASSLVASAVNQVPVEVIAIEKNPNAVRTLRHRFAQFITEPTTHNRVRIIEGDMRERVVPVPVAAAAAGAGASHEEDSTTATATIGVGSVHIIVSELLGSFADNEASPECLYAIEHALHPRHGIMIPQSYTSYLVPVSASSLWQQARTMFSHHGGKNQFQQQGLDYPYVVHLHSHATYGGAAQPVFQFVHPSHAKDIHVPTATSLFPAASPSPSSPSPSPSSSSQQKIIALGNQSRQVSFVMDQATTLHGVAGYFHCTLYKDIVFSTVPEQIGTLSPGMFSWFPMYFPMTHPVSVRAGDTVDVNMWRCVDGDRMWYEWSIRARAAASSGSPPPPPTTPAATVGPLAAVQNTLGRAFHVQL